MKFVAQKLNIDIFIIQPKYGNITVSLTIFLNDLYNFKNFAVGDTPLKYDPKLSSEFL